MPTDMETRVAAAEERLRLAMLASDVKTLDELISTDLIFTNHLGQLLGKQDDLESHRLGALKFYTLEPSEGKMRASGNTAIVSVRMRASGAYCGSPWAADLRFTRVWHLSQSDTWQIVAGHSSAVQE